MPKLMLINVTHSEESRVAIIDDRRLESFEIESLSREHLKGNIYKGVVHRIHPALEAAFVDIGGERDAFLPLDEICFRNLANPAPPPPAGEDGKKGRRRIRDLFKPGEEILVQIAKEQFANKPPTLTTFYSLPGRYLVLLAGSDDTGISRRIEGEERQRLRKLVEALNPPEGFGLIVRTAAGLDEETGELARDLTYLQRLWDSVQEAARHKRAPALVYREQDIVLRTIRDLFTPDIDEIHIDNEDVYLRAREFLSNVMPGKEQVLHCYRGEQPIFSAFDVESQIETVFKRRVPLRSGGTIVIDGTEALTAIDVNSGGSVRSANPEETAFRTNMEAAAEVARQFRLRDIGGLIVIDFIDMRDNRHIQEVEQTLRTAMKPDKARHEVGRISRLGLLEISRQRMRPAATATTYTSCPMCEGHGAVRTTESAALVALRKIHNRVALGDVAALRVSLPAAVALYLLNQKREELARLEEHYDSRIQIELRDGLMSHQIEIDVRQRAKVEKPPAVAPGAVASAGTPPAAAVAANSASANGAAASNGAAAPSANGAKKKRRRRGRRRGTGLRAATAIGVALATLGGVNPAPFEAAAAARLAPSGESDDADEQGFEDDVEDEDADDTEESTGAVPAVAVAAADATPDDGIVPAAVIPARTEPLHPTASAQQRTRGRRGGRRHRGNERQPDRQANHPPRRAPASPTATEPGPREVRPGSAVSPAVAAAPISRPAPDPAPVSRDHGNATEAPVVSQAEQPAPEGSRSRRRTTATKPRTSRAPKAPSATKSTVTEGAAPAKPRVRRATPKAKAPAKPAAKASAKSAKPKRAPSRAKTPAE
ncbi:MAG: Rne/Rng family ribonuclease [bacterium]